MSASRPSTRWSRFSMCASRVPRPFSTRVRRDSKLAMSSLDFPLDFGRTGSRCSSHPRPCCDDSTLVVSYPATYFLMVFVMASTKALIPLVTQLLFLVSRRAALALPQMLRNP
ncbi:hypothetical protein M9H77_30067 [Catharanthus roseus]|uniref:Uncharacterized protein n=1 Tax=Catharanthus roseus TaxID=4058 RepID=A0ACB9ZY29_CATRO|nr:hypothetical protein M9H77_30067 [Catharanthus roseus]